MKFSRDAGGNTADLSNCDREPIHIPGRVQPHGVLFALDGPAFTVAQVSENCGDLLGVSPADLLGTPVVDWVAAEDRNGLRAALAADDPRPANPLRVTVERAGRAFDGVAHRYDGVLILELDHPRPAGPAGPPPDHSRSIQRAMTRLRGAGTFRDFCQVVVEEARALGGFDRAMVYRFDHEWNGEVLAESKRDDLSPLLGLHFPASDIPEQARRMYHLSPVRMIAEVASSPAPLVPEINPTTGRPLDLSLSVLRSVSPVHIQYLKNMGATASMSISLMREGRLWGLISCLQYGGALRLPFADRAACEFLGALVSVQLAVKEDAEGVEYRSRLQSVRERLLQRMAEEPDLVAGLLNDPPDLLHLTAAAGAAVVHDGVCAVRGKTPPEDVVKKIVAWLRVHAQADVFQTDSLPRVCPDARDHSATASGLVAVTTSRPHGHWVLWFRPEVVQTVDWGGDPHKPVSGVGPTGLLSPRQSFELWREVVHQKSLPWQPAEVEAARLLRDAVVAVVVRRAEELTRLNVELKRSNTDLDAFAFSASHDLKEPLRGIHNYATFLLEDYADKLDQPGVDKLNTLVRLTQRMDNLIESLLRYSQLGRQGTAVDLVDLNDVLAGALEGLRGRLDADKVEVRVPRPLPTVRCDRVQVGELFANLIANAAKYNDKPGRWVEVGYAEPVPAGGGDLPDPAPVFFVRDNGIGIPDQHRDVIFRLFKRLHARDKFGGGTGVGLAIAKKIAERHGGTMWVESAPGAGSTFWFTLRG